MNIYIFFLFVVLLFFPNQGTTQTILPEVPRIDAAMAYYKYNAGNTILIDAMTRETFAKRHALGAINLSNDGPGDLERIMNMELPIPKDKEILVYCGWTGEVSSAVLALILIKKGFKRTFVVKGGDWEMMEAGIPWVIDGKIEVFHKR